MSQTQPGADHIDERFAERLSDRGITRSARILLVDDDVALAEMLSLVLLNEGFDQSWCSHGDEALDAFRDARPDLVLLDVMLPGTDGVSICRAIREESLVPIVMLTARSDSVDVVAGLEAGADDYVAKPFKTKELIARIRTRLRRWPAEDHVAEVVRVGDLVINIDGHSVRRGDTSISLTPLEFALLLTLARHPGQVFSREVLLQQVWGYPEAGADTRLVTVHVQRVRAKIERDREHPEIIVTVRGVGYQAVSPS